MNRIRVVTAVAVAVVTMMSGCALVEPAPHEPSVSRAPMVVPSMAGTIAASATPGAPSPSSSASAETIPVAAFAPKATKKTEPSRFGLQSAIQRNGKIVKTYKRSRPIDFGMGAEYTTLPGVITFRGNPLRDTGSYGTAELSAKKFGGSHWEVPTGEMRKTTGVGAWSGTGWTGQPLLVQWPDDTRRVLKRNSEALKKQGLVEAIYATMDGHVYFLDAQTGKRTREPVNLGFPFKGAGALDPRGIPIMYVGSGDNAPGGGASHVFVISLVDGKKLFEFGAHDSFAQRNWSGMDSSALVDAASDTLIYCGENGIVYTFHLNTKWNAKTGALSIKPDETVKYRYRTSRSSDARYWLGIESSPVILGHYLIAGDNGGNLICLDLNTMKMVWMQNILDDTNDSPVVEIGADGKPYVYISTSLHWTAKSGKGTIPVWKIDATTGEKIWQKDYPCDTVEGVSGGVQATVALGKNKAAGLVYAAVARTPSLSAGRLVALDTKTGKEKWAFKTANYAWSSPVVVYDPDGNGYLIYCDSGGTIYLLDALTGKKLDTFNAGANIESTPAVFGDRVIVGTRGQRIWGLKLT